MSQGVNSSTLVLVQTIEEEEEEEEEEEDISNGDKPIGKRTTRQTFTCSRLQRLWQIHKSKIMLSMKSTDICICLHWEVNSIQCTLIALLLDTWMRSG